MRAARYPDGAWHASCGGRAMEALMRLHNRVIGALTTGLILSATTGWALQALKTPSDAGIRTQVEQGLADRKISGVAVTVSQGVVTVEGRVVSAWVRNQACEPLRKVAGVASVNCNVTVRREATDWVLALEVERRIQDYAFYTIHDNVEVAVKDGRVTLTGEVMADARVRMIADIAARVPGVAEVGDLVRTMESSPKDDAIRYEIAGRIYSNPVFAYEEIPNAVHIVVENGRVKLTGLVPSELERQMAAMLASGVPGVVRVENRLRCMTDE